MRCGLLGEKLRHSYSPQIHAYLGDYSYELFEKSPDALSDFLKNGDFTGLNVTIPYKKAVIEHCAELSDRAKQLGAVNVIVRRADGSLIGHNTDYFGFVSALKRSGAQVSGKKVLVLGSGGASATAVAVLKSLSADVIVISRTGENNYDNIAKHTDAAFIINATPVGMYPNVGVSPVDISLFEALEGVMDLIYNPANTKLLMQAQQRGLIALNGLWMLVAQAKEAAEWFTGEAIADSVIEKIYNQLRRQMENIILIGMPGCGKSTVCTLLAKKLNMPFVDSDAMIVATAGKPIPEIFANDGEDAFRALETEVLAELGKKSGQIIATGGGCVTRPENYPLLHQNGQIVWLQRDIAALATDGRPLSQAGKLEELFAVREQLYNRFCDFCVQNNTSAEQTADEIIKLLNKEGRV